MDPLGLDLTNRYGNEYSVRSEVVTCDNEVGAGVGDLRLLHCESGEVIGYLFAHTVRLGNVLGSLHEYH